MLLALCDDLESHMHFASLMALAVIMGRIATMPESKSTRARNILGLRQILTLHKSDECQVTTQRPVAQRYLASLFILIILFQTRINNT